LQNIFLIFQGSREDNVKVSLVHRTHQVLPGTERNNLRTHVYFVRNIMKL